MQIAMKVGKCSGEDADLLRRAMGSKRGVEKIERVKERLFEGFAEHEITGELAESLYQRILAFADFGFAESHSISFALLVYASSWLKLHYPAAFLAGLLRTQPMGFYSPQSLVADARRHGVEVCRPDVLRSGVHSDLEPLIEGVTGPTGPDTCLLAHQPPVPTFDPTLGHRRDGSHAVRIGLTSMQQIGEADAKRIVAARAEAPLRNMADVARRAGLSVAQLESLATAGAFDCFGLTRREALWNAGYIDHPDYLEGTGVSSPPPTLPGMSEVEITTADLWATGISPAEHPMSHLRELMQRYGVLAVTDLAGQQTGRRVRVAGLITHRQRPHTAGGVTFLNLEDETGMLNVVVFDAVGRRDRRVLRNAAGVVIYGVVEHTDGAINLKAEAMERIESLYPEAISALPARHRSRDYR